MSIFGTEFEQIWPKAGSALKLTDFGKSLLQKCQNIEKPDASKINVQQFITKSSNFPVEFGTNTCRVISQPKERHPIIEKQIASAYPVIHERVLGLYLAFLEHKCQYGNPIELKVYTKLTLTDFVQRLLAKRCVTFFDPQDQYKLMSGIKGVGGFTIVGRSIEKPPLMLENVLSYDEIKLSAFLSVSSHSEFINDGDRYNSGKIEPNKSKIEIEGVIVGVIGGRFEVTLVMESQDILITKAQNTKDNGYGVKGNTSASVNNRETDYRRLWNQFYEEDDFLYNEVASLESPRFSRAGFNIFDNLLMKKRYTISFDTLLLESEEKAAVADKQAYIHVVGIGLGVWRATDHQSKIFLETFSQRLKALLPRLKHVSVVHFSWFKMCDWGELRYGTKFECEEHPNGGITIYLTNRSPAAKLKPEFSDMLLVVSYAWDGNALPGNEFWVGMLSSSGDSSTACSTLITELHNPHINTEMVNGNNLHVATLQHGVMHIADYSKKVLAQDG